MSKPRCLGYIRFSSTAQSDGTSVERQLENIKTYAAKHNLDIHDDDIFIDKAVSAFMGKNRKSGKLGEMLAKIESGEIPNGTALITESLDRLSRENVFDVLKFCGVLFDYDMKIVSLSDGKVYSSGPDLGDILQLVITAARANDESNTKRYRSTNNWQIMRNNIATNKMTGRCPAWLSLNEDKTEFIIDQDRADLIKKMFDLSYSGMGIKSIAKKFNLENEIAWVTRKKRKTEGWQPSYVGKILNSRAVICEFQPHVLSKETGKRIPIGNVVTDYFPRIIDDQLFYAVQAKMKDKTHMGGKTGKLSNLFGGIAQCGYCGGKIQIVDKGNDSKYLICDNAHRGVKCLHISTRYDEIENTFIDFCINEIKYVIKNDADTKMNKVNELQELKSSSVGLLDKLKNNITLIESKLKNAQDGLSFDYLLKLQSDQQNEKTTIENNLVNIDSDIYELTTVNMDSDDIVDEILYIIKNQNAATNEADRISFRLKLRNQIRNIVDKVRIYPLGILSTEDMNLISKKHSESKTVAAKYSKDSRYFAIDFLNGDQRFIVHNKRMGGYYVKSERVGENRKNISLQSKFDKKIVRTPEDELMFLDDEIKYYMMVSGKTLTEKEFESMRRFLSGAYVYDENGNEEEVPFWCI